jgi:hypothetical protein
MQMSCNSIANKNYLQDSSDADGRRIAAFWPDVVGIPIEERHLQYEWDSEKGRALFRLQREAWTSLA